MPTGVYKHKPLSKEHKKKLSEKLKGRTKSEEHKKNLSRALIGNKNYLLKINFKHSDFTKKKISKTLKEKCIKPKCQFIGIGNKNPNWKGSNISKQQKHIRIRKEFGSPYYCEYCKRTDKKKYEWANIDHLYSLNRKDYLRLCTSCHRKYDIKNNNYGKKI